MDTACKQCSSPFTITDADRAMMDRIAPVVAGKTLSLPNPTLCPTCRNQRKFSFRNDSNYYRNVCTHCGKAVISIYSPDKEVKVLCDDCFWSDSHDPLAYGKDIDWNRPFFEQYAEMRAAVPRLAIFHTQSENSDYTVHSSKNKNCYMGSSLVDDEDVYYSDWVIRSRDTVDCLTSTGMELCYECIDCRDCFNSDYAELCTSLVDSVHCFDCHRSQALVGCVSLRDKKAMILNEVSDERTVKETIDRLKHDAAFRTDFLKKYEALKLRVPKRSAWNINTENCTGDYITNSRNARHTFHSDYIEDGNYVHDVTKGKDVMDVMRMSGAELLYECANIVDLSRSCFCTLTYQCQEMLYSDNCNGANSCFGCFGLKKNRYCILNKQYTKDDYDALVLKLVEHMKKTGEWGEFFPHRLAAFGYNETKAHEWYPLLHEETLKRGWNWSDYQQETPKDLKTISGKDLPHTIEEVPDAILNVIITCEVTGKPYRLVPQELEFYRKKHLPVPRRSPRQRHLDRVSHQNPRVLCDRACDRCKKTVHTTYSPQRPEKVFCEACYLDTAI